MQRIRKESLVRRGVVLAKRRRHCGHGKCCEELGSPVAWDGVEEWVRGYDASEPVLHPLEEDVFVVGVGDCVAWVGGGAEGVGPDFSLVGEPEPSMRVRGCVGLG